MVLTNCFGGLARFYQLFIKTWFQTLPPFVLNSATHIMVFSKRPFKCQLHIGHQQKVSTTGRHKLIAVSYISYC